MQDVKDFFRQHIVLGVSFGRRVLFTELAAWLIAFAALRRVDRFLLYVADDDPLDFGACLAVLAHQSRPLAAQLAADIRLSISLVEFSRVRRSVHHVVLLGSLGGSMALSCLTLPSLGCKRTSRWESMAIKSVGLCNDVDDDGGVLGQECFVVDFFPFKHFVHLREGPAAIWNLLSWNKLSSGCLDCAGLDGLSDDLGIGVELDSGKAKVLQMQSSDEVEEPV